MRPLLKYIISLSIFLVPFAGIAQDSLQSRGGRLALDLSADYGKSIESLLQKQSKWEFGTGLIFQQHYKFVAEYGFGSLNPENAINNGAYNSEGNYYRVGFEYIFILKSKRYLSTGIMYGSSKFRDSVYVQIISEFWENLELSSQRENLSASWVEWVLNTEGPLSDAKKGFLTNVYWGMKFRIRFLMSDISQPNFDIFAIPGYGKTFSNVVPAVNLFIKYRFTF